MHITEDDIVAVGGNLDPQTLIQAYGVGVFPWPMAGEDLLPWFCPQRRAILDRKNLHLAKSLQKFIKKAPYIFSVNQCFAEVIKHCQTMKRKDQMSSAQDNSSEPNTWITDAMANAYQELHRLGYAHSIEVWNRDDQTLVGGLYGVSVNRYFSAESMFHLQTNASKLAIVFLLNYLHDQDLNWIDIQVLTPHLEALGAHEVSRNDFLKKIKKEQTKKTALVFE